MVPPIVIIEQGTLKGSIANDIRGNPFYKFQGIPYAKPPLGKLRFKAPVPPEKWDGIFDCTKEGATCYSREPLKNRAALGSENCLFLNVYTKKLREETPHLRPVLFWIHGGGFFFGSGNEELYGPDFLLTEDIVLVTINYRLGILGFISFKDPSIGISGNGGFKDQLMALKWVQKNIAQFGGDPNNVTIFGQSAGGGCVHCLVLSPAGKGLFHKAIAQSGCALNPWVIGTCGVHHIGEIMGLKGASERTIYEALVEKTMEELFEIQEQLFQNRAASKPRPIGTVIERNSTDAVLDEDPMKIIESGSFNHVPMMFGYNTAEGMIYELEKKDQTIPDFEDMIPWFFGYESGTIESRDLAKKIETFYFGEQGFLESSISKKIDVLGDCHFIYGIYSSVMAHKKVSKCPIYLYRMSIETRLNLLKQLLDIDQPGAAHLDDVGYLFKNFTTPTITPGSVEETAIFRFVKLWTNFAKFGDPTPSGTNDNLLKVQWNPVSGENIEFLEIGKTLQAFQNPTPERLNFWRNLFMDSPAGKKILAQNED